MSEQSKIDSERAAYLSWYMETYQWRPVAFDGSSDYLAFVSGLRRGQARASLPDGYMPIPTADQLAEALENVGSFHDMSAELIAPELLANLTASKDCLVVGSSLPVGVQDAQCGAKVTGLAADNARYNETVRRIEFAISAAQPLKAEQADDRAECIADGLSVGMRQEEAEEFADKIAAPSLPAAGSPAEEVVVVAYRTPSGGLYQDKEIAEVCVRTGHRCAITELMTAAQHERIVAALRAQLREANNLADQWAEKNRSLSAQQSAPVADYEECLSNHRRLVRELDVLLNGEYGAAPQASLCDIVGQVSSIVRDEGIPLLGAFSARKYAPERVGVPKLSDKEREDLLEFHDAVCCDAGHRVDKEGMRRLAEIGAVQPVGFGRHRLTEFGVALIDSHGRGEA